MKKTVKLLSTILLVIMLMVSVSGIVLADSTTEMIDKLGKGDAETGDIEDLGAKIVNVVQVLGIIVAIVIILVIGIKYLTSSAEGKAEYKKIMIPYVIGAVLIFAGTSIVKAVYSMTTGL